MIKAIYELDMTPRRTLPIIINVSQYDDIGRTLVFNLFSSSGKWTAPTSAAVTFEGGKPDGKFFAYSCAYSNGTVTVTIQQQMTAVAGKVRCKIKVKSGDKVVESAPIIMIVDAAAVPDGSDMSKSDINDAIANATQKIVDQVKDNIPSDYSQLSTDVSSLKQDKVDKPSTSDDGKIPRAKEGGVEWVKVGQPTDDQTHNAVTGWLNEHPEATTTVQDGVIEEKKISEKFLPWIKNDYVTPEMFGAVGNGRSDDTIAIQNALNSGKTVMFTNSYLIKNTLNANNCDIFLHGVNSSIIIETNIDGVYLYGKCLVRGTGTIKVNVNNYSKAVITVFSGNRYTEIDVNIEGFNYKTPQGTGILFLTTKDTGASATDAIGFCNVLGQIRYFEKGVDINPDKSWINCLKLEFYSYYNIYSIYHNYDRPTESNYIKISGQAALTNDITDYNMYFKKLSNSTIIWGVTDIGRDGFEPYPMYIGDDSYSNVIIGNQGGLIGYVGGAYNYNYYSLLDSCFKAAPIPGIVDSLCCADDLYTVTYEPFGEGTIINDSRPFYYEDNMPNKLKYSNNNYLNLEPNDWGAIVTVDFGKLIYADCLKLEIPISNHLPFRLYVSVKIEDGSWTEYSLLAKTQIEFKTPLSLWKVGQTRNLYGIKLKFCGAIETFNRKLEYAEVYAIALGGTRDGYNRTYSFQPITRYGGTMKGDLKFERDRNPIICSPNGTLYKIKVNDDGTLVTAKIPSTLESTN